MFYSYLKKKKKNPHFEENHSMDPYLVHCIKFLTINMIVGPGKKKKKKEATKATKEKTIYCRTHK